MSSLGADSDVPYCHEDEEGSEDDEDIENDGDGVEDEAASEDYKLTHRIVSGNVSLQLMKEIKKKEKPHV